MAKFKKVNPDKDQLFNEIVQRLDQDANVYEVWSSFHEVWPSKPGRYYLILNGETILDRSWDKKDIGEWVTTFENILVKNINSLNDQIRSMIRERNEMLDLLSIEQQKRRLEEDK